MTFCALGLIRKIEDVLRMFAKCKFCLWIAIDSGATDGGSATPFVCHSLYYTNNRMCWRIKGTLGLWTVYGN